MTKGGPFGASTVLDTALHEQPDSEAVVGRSGRLTYRQLDHLAEQTTAALVASGVRPGDRLGVSLAN
ncbi:MAG: AMP-binding enzyme, partial [Acidimicrobiaceae bacterium]|nr:AMP-binding enzyme [Acidimicrobiaceae bacterium]